MTDRRLTPANGRVALLALKGKVAAETYVAGEPARIVAPLADLCDRPRGARDRQLLHGAAVTVLERRAGWAFVQAAADGYCGYVADRTLGPPQAATHWVAVPATIAFAAASLKAKAGAVLSLGARLHIRATGARFSETGEGQYVPSRHLRAIGDWAGDPVSVAESLLGTPYLWGGNSRQGIDCSGLVQVALWATGRDCPADSDLQRAALGADLPPGADYRRGDLLFWPGHVAMAVSADRLIHANGHHAAVGYEEIAACIARIEASGEGPLMAVKRL